MAKIMTVPNVYTGECVEAYWIPVQVNLNKLTKTGYVMFAAFASKASREASRPALAIHDYSVTPAQWEEFFSSSSTDIYGQCYRLAESDSFFATSRDDI